MIRTCRPRPRLRPAGAHRVRPAHPRRGRLAPRLRLRLAAGDRRRARPARLDGAVARRQGPRGVLRRRLVGLARRHRGDRGRRAQPARDRRVPPPHHAGARAVAARPGAAGAQHAAALARGHRRPLRPRQRPVRADARRDDDVLGRDLRAPRHDARGGLAGQARPHLRQARPAAVRPRAGDRHRLGRLRHPRRLDARLPRDDDDAVARAARAGAGARARGGARGPRDGPARRLPRADRHLRQARLDRDDRGRRLEGLRHVLRALRRRCCAPTA